MFLAVIITTKQISQQVNVSELKYYFTVDTNYVVSKLKLILFPFSAPVRSTSPITQPRTDAAGV